MRDASACVRRHQASALAPVRVSRNRVRGLKGYSPLFKHITIWHTMSFVIVTGGRGKAWCFPIHTQRLYRRFLWFLKTHTLVLGRPQTSHRITSCEPGSIWIPSRSRSSNRMSSPPRARTVTPWFRARHSFPSLSISTITFLGCLGHVNDYRQAEEPYDRRFRVYTDAPSFRHGAQS